MSRLGGFEPRPVIAVGVSGGADSMALTMLAHRWAVERGGSVLALTVDHGLRQDAADEAAVVGRRLAAWGVRHETLRWEGDKPRSGIQDAARGARRLLLSERCRAEGILHLALAHHRDDQAETVLLRLSRGSGPDGLAAMAAFRWDRDVRLIRPLLDLSHVRLVATCAVLGQSWVEDPSNRNPAYARARLRAAGQALAGEGLSAEALALTAWRCARSRSALEHQTAGLLAESVAIQPEGWAMVDAGRLLAAPDDLALRALGRVLVAVGGEPYAPKAEAVARLLKALRAAPGRGRTLGGCVLTPHRAGLAVAREPAAAVERLAVEPGRPVWWDRRFMIQARASATVARLGAEGWAELRARNPDLERLKLPVAARESLPALWAGARLLACPAVQSASPGQDVVVESMFTPPEPLVGPAFPVV